MTVNKLGRDDYMTSTEMRYKLEALRKPTQQAMIELTRSKKREADIQQLQSLVKDLKGQLENMPSVCILFKKAHDEGGS